MSNENPWKTLKTNKIYSNPWIELQHDEVLTPGGSAGIYGKVHFKNLAIGIIPLDQEMHTWIIGQYRYPLDQYCWEIPAGGCPLGTAPLASAKRELEEETGLVARKWDLIMNIHTSNAVCDEYAHLYLARDLTMGVAQPEESEQLELRKLHLDELVTMVHKGSITDAMSVTSIMKVDWMRHQGLLD